MRDTCPRLSREQISRMVAQMTTPDARQVVLGGTMKRFNETEVLETILCGFGRALKNPGKPTRIRFEKFNRVILVVLDKDDKDDLTFLGAYAGMIAGELRRNVIEGRKPRFGVDIRPICGGLVIRDERSAREEGNN